MRPRHGPAKSLCSVTADIVPTLHHDGAYASIGLWTRMPFMDNSTPTDPTGALTPHTGRGLPVKVHGDQWANLIREATSLSQKGASAPVAFRIQTWSSSRITRPAFSDEDISNPTEPLIFILY
jgi:hypothetical protein